MPDETRTLYVWGQQTNRAGTRAWLDDDDLDEDGDPISADYDRFTGTPTELREIAAELRKRDDVLSLRVAALLEDEAR